MTNKTNKTATRIYFKADKEQVLEKEISFPFYSGFAPIQKRKNRDCMHESILKQEPKAKILEVSTKSNDKFGVNLSAFNLELDSRPFECTFQEAKRFEISDSIKTKIEIDSKGKGKFIVDISDKLINDGESYYLAPISDNPRELKSTIKAFCKANKSAKLSHFNFRGEIFELNAGVANSASFFYDFLYFRALRENFSQSEIAQILDYDIFTDIEFNHKVSINCQARSCALYRYALLNKKVDFYTQSKENFKSIYANLTSAKDKQAQCGLF